MVKQTDEEKKLYKAFMDGVRECLEEVENEPVILVPGDLSEPEIREYLMEQYLVKRLDMSEEEILEEIEKWIQGIRDLKDDKEMRYIRYGKELDEVIMTHASEGRDVIEKAIREYFIKEYKRAYPEKSEEWIKNEVEEEVNLMIKDDPVTFVINKRMVRAQR